MTRGELERRLERWREQISRDRELAIDEAMSELRDDLHTAVLELNRRIDGVHSEALKALTRTVAKGT